MLPLVSALHGDLLTMNEVRATIQKLLEVTVNPQDNYPKIFDLYPENPVYDRLHYHTVEHVIAVMRLFTVLRLLRGQFFDTKHVMIAELALAFHDINHTGHSDTFVNDYGWGNISFALATLGRHKKKCGTLDVPLIASYIEATEYPHKDLPEVIALLDTDVLALVRDADILWGMLPGCAEQSMVGLWRERFDAGIDRVMPSPQQMLDRQLKFIHEYVPFSQAGRSFKDAMMEEAVAAWSRMNY